MKRTNGYKYTDSIRYDDIIVNNTGLTLSKVKLFSNLIKYDRLHEILKDSLFLEGFPSEVNVFIDMYQLTVELYKFNNILKPINILSSFINMGLHYRNFFNKLRIKSNIFMLYSTNQSPNNKKHIARYNEKYNVRMNNNREVFKIISNNIELMKTLCPYLPGIYLKIGTVEPSVMAYDIIDKFNKNSVNTPSLFITNSDYSFQLPVVIDNTIVLFKRNSLLKDKSIEDISFPITKYNSLFLYILKTKNVNIENMDEYRYIDQRWITAFMALSGLQQRNLTSLFSYSESLLILNRLRLSYSVISPESLFDAVNDTLKKPFYDRREIFNRYLGIDIKYQLKLYRELPESIENSFLTDINDLETLYRINDEYFDIANRIDLEKL